MRVVILNCFLMLAFTSYAQVSFTEIEDNTNLFSTKNARGITIADFDNDGLDDLFIAAEPLKILKNEGNFTFSDHSQTSGISQTNAKSIAVFDADNDGLLDVLIASYRETILYLNNGDLTFRLGSNYSALNRQSMNIGDLNGDQWPDIYSANINQDNNIYINQGAGRFVNAEGDASTNTLDMGSLMIDIDEDGDLDIYLTYDGDQPNDLLINDGTGKFTNEAQEWGLDNRSNAMGVDIADFDLDGDFDFFIANLWENDLLINNGDDTFNEIGASAQVDDYGMGWGTVCFDYDNDGWTDIYFNNEFLFSSFPNQLLRNNGDLTFTDVALGTPLMNTKSGYGCAAADLDNDGLQDIILVNLQEDKSIRIFKNENQNTGSWIQFSLVGTNSNKFGIGAKLNVHVGETIYRKNVTIGSGYRSQNSFRQHIGIGNASDIDSLVLTWPNGLVEVHRDLTANQHYMISEGQNPSSFSASEFESVLSTASQLDEPTQTEEIEINLSDNRSVAREWMEVLLSAIRGDFARPTVHARNLFHLSMAMYEAYASMSPDDQNMFLGQNFGGFETPFDGFQPEVSIEEAQKEALSYAAYRLILHRFSRSPSADETFGNSYQLMQTLGYDPNITDDDYASGSPAMLGNYIANQIIEFGIQDGSNENNDYENRFYSPINPPMNPAEAGNPSVVDPNRWQQLELEESIDQSGQPVASILPFLSPEWGRVTPFSLSEDDITIYTRDAFDYYVYHDPGPPPTLDVENGDGTSDEYKWNFELVPLWSSQLDPADQTMIDISPNSIGNIQEEDYPTTYEEYLAFYPNEGGDPSLGYEINPSTGNPYAEQIVPLGDYGRILAEFWADGPDSETPPGHWFTILNYVSDHPALERRFQGQGEALGLLEWDVKSYVTLGGAMHDVAITAWGIKGYYDYTRPIFAIRYMADLGQSTDPELSNYHPAGIQLMPGHVEVVEENDELAGASNEHVGKIKLRTWKGPDYINDPAEDVAGVGWILAENWWPYQRPSFVTPPFAGYVSGHSTFSRAAAEVISLLTGDEYFPGGLGEFSAPKDDFLVFEKGPSIDVVLQWAKYKDASDQCSLSRIWGGIHPPVDDIPGRLIGRVVGQDAFDKASSYFGNQNPLSVQESSSLVPFVFPNPIVRSDQFTIGNASEILEVNCWDRSGKVVFTNLKASQNGLYKANFDNSGIYFLEIITEERSYIRKIIVKD